MIDSRVLSLFDRFQIADERLVVDGRIWPASTPVVHEYSGGTSQWPEESTGSAEHAVDVDGQRFLSAVSDAIYQVAYAHLPIDKSSESISADEQAADDDFVDDIIEAHQTRERWDAGWTLDDLSPTGHVSVARDADWRYAAPGDFRVDPAGRGLAAGARIALLVRPFDLESQPGSIYLHADRHDDRVSFSWLGRFYFNAGDAEMPNWIRCLSSLLNRHAVPFTLKCPAHRRLCARLDSLVLYVPIRHCAFTARLLDRVHLEAGSLIDALSDETPLMSKPLARGIGFAEDPGNGDSFGTHRSRVLASALIDHATNNGDIAGWRRRLTQTFAANGLDIEAPWLSPGSTDRFKTPALSRAHPSGQANVSLTSERSDTVLPRVAIDPNLFGTSSRTRS